MRHSLPCLIQSMPLSHEEAMQCSGRFDGDSAQKLADWQVQFEACLRGEAAPPRELLRMLPDIQNHMRAAQSRFLFFKMDTVKTTTLVRGTASGRPVNIRFQPGVEVMVRLAKLPNVIAEPVFAVDLYLLTFTATYQKDRDDLRLQKWTKPARFHFSGQEEPCSQHHKVWTWIQKFSRLVQNKHEVIVTRSCVTLRDRK